MGTTLCSPTLGMFQKHPTATLTLHIRSHRDQSDRSNEFTVVIPVDADRDDGFSVLRRHHDPGMFMARGVDLLRGEVLFCRHAQHQVDDVIDSIGTPWDEFHHTAGETGPASGCRDREARTAATTADAMSTTPATTAVTFSAESSPVRISSTMT